MTKIKCLLSQMKDKISAVICIICVLILAATGFAYAKYALDVDSDVSVNINATGDIEIAVTENGDGTYRISHGAGSRTPAYVRFAVVVNWADGSGNLYYTQPKDYTVTAPGCGKVDNYYYYNGYLPVDGVIGDIAITLGDGVSAPVEYPNLRVQILAEGIQCLPESVAQDAWGVSFNGTSWVK